jgi:hypothetical protein
MFSAIMITLLSVSVLALGIGIGLMYTSLRSTQAQLTDLQTTYWSGMDSVSENFVTDATFNNQVDMIQRDIDGVIEDLATAVDGSTYDRDYRMFNGRVSQLNSRVEKMEIDTRAFMRKHRWALDTIKQAEAIRDGVAAPTPLVMATSDQVKQAIMTSVKSRKHSNYGANGVANGASKAAEMATAGV